jgi:cytochrome c oxidase cbb3-type subunit I/II
MTQAKEISMLLNNDSIRISPNKEVIALISYLQRLGTDISKNANAQK